MGTQPLQRIVDGPCQMCGKPVKYIMPTPRIFNEIDISVLAMAHPPSRCNECGTIHMPLIEGLDENGQLLLVWKPVKAARSPIIAGGDSNTLKQAIAQAQFTDNLKKN